MAFTNWGEVLARHGNLREGKMPTDLIVIPFFANGCSSTRKAGEPTA